MKKTFLLPFVLVLCTHTLFAQSYSSTISYDKTDKPALVLQLPYKESIAEDFILTNLKKTGYDVETKGKLFWKKEKLNGFYVFKEVMLTGMTAPVDLYFKVDPRGRKSSNQSIIHMLVSKGNESFVAPSDSVTYAAASNFLNSFVGESAAYKLNKDIEAQEAAVKDAEKKLAKLQDNEKDITKKMRDLEEDLKKNKNDQESQQKAIEDERRKLAELRAKGQTL